jgi:sporulation protein YlmC with PRC-barrel domain
MTEKKGETVPSQKFIGMQVIDSKGTSVGTVKDIGINIAEREFNLIVTTRAGSEMQIPWDDIQSAVDVVLLGKGVALPKPPEVTQVPMPPPPPPPSNCPKCGTPVIATARFCPKCGTKLR